MNIVDIALYTSRVQFPKQQRPWNYIGLYMCRPIYCRVEALETCTTPWSVRSNKTPVWQCNHISNTLQWRHNERPGVSNHHWLDCLFNRLFRLTSKETLNLTLLAFCEGGPPVTYRWPVIWCICKISLFSLLKLLNNPIPTNHQPSETNFSKIEIKSHQFQFNKIHFNIPLKMMTSLFRPRYIST